MEEVDFTISATTAVYTPGRTPLPLSPPKPFESRSVSGMSSGGHQVRHPPARSLSSNQATNDITAEGTSEGASVSLCRRSTPGSRATPTPTHSSGGHVHADTVPASIRSIHSTGSSVPPLRFSVSPETVEKKRRVHSPDTQHLPNHLPYGDERLSAHDAVQEAQYTLNEVSCIQTLLEKGIDRLDRAQQRRSGSSHKRSHSARSSAVSASSIPQPQPLPAAVAKRNMQTTVTVASPSNSILQKELQRALQQKASAEEERDSLKAAAAASNAELRVVQDALQRAMLSLETGATRRKLTPPQQYYVPRRSVSVSTDVHDASAALIEGQRRAPALRARSSSLGGAPVQRSRGPSHPQRVVESARSVRSVSPPARFPSEMVAVKKAVKPARIPLGKVQPNVVHSRNPIAKPTFTAVTGRPRHALYKTAEGGSGGAGNTNESVVITSRTKPTIAPAKRGRKVVRASAVVCEDVFYFYFLSSLNFI